jgi:putative ABC transport system substrate-binding protein
MNKKLLWLLTVFLLACLHLAQAQKPNKVPRIGYVSGGTGDSDTPAPQIEAFRQGLRDLGYTEGKNILVEYRSAAGKLDRLRGFMAELVQLNVDVLVSTNLVATRAAKEATESIPIVILTVQDPVATGIIESLASPGGNITGLTTLARDLSGKRLELLKEISGMSRVGVLWDANAPGPVIGFKEYEAAARALKIALESLEVRGPNVDLERAFRAATNGGVNALVTIRNPALRRYIKRIADLAIKNRLASIYEASEWVEAGGLLSYAANDAENYRRLVTYVDKILKGAKPADLPVEQPTKFELVINLKTAKQIGLTIPPNVLARADKVIK